MRATIAYIFITAWRDKMFWVLLAGVLGGAVIAHMLGETATSDVQALTISYSSNTARVMLVIGLIIFTCSHLHNAFYTNEVDVFLSRPITRANLVLAYWLGFANVAFIHTLAVVILTAFQGVGDWSGFLWWSVSLLMECWIVVAIALFASFTIKSGVFSIIASLGFYVMARMMGYFMITTKSAFLFDQQWVNLALVDTLKVISVFMPRLDFFAKDDWLTYGVRHASTAIPLFAEQAVIFIPLLLLATIADFRRREF